MSFSLAVAGFTAQEKSALIKILKEHSSHLNSIWTLYWRPQEYPAHLDALLFNAHSAEGQEWHQKNLKTKVIPIAVYDPKHIAPSTTSLFIRQPFDPAALIHTLNTCAKRLQHLAKSTPVELTPFEAEELELQFSFPNVHLVSKISLFLYAIYHQAPKDYFYKILSKSTDLEIWCFPKQLTYWSNRSEKIIANLTDSDLQLIRHNHAEQAILQKHNHTLSANNLLWHTGLKAMRSTELLPFFSSYTALGLKRYPIVPENARTKNTILILLQLTRNPTSVAHLLTYLNRGRKEVYQVLNALIMIDALERYSHALPINPPSVDFTPEHIIFLRSLSLKLQEELDK